MLQSSYILKMFFSLEGIKFENIFGAGIFGFFFYRQWNLYTKLNKKCYLFILHNSYQVSKLKLRSNLHVILLFHRSLMISLKFIAMRSDDDLTQTFLLSIFYYKSCTASVAIVLDITWFECKPKPMEQAGISGGILSNIGFVIYIYIISISWTVLKITPW